MLFYMPNNLAERLKFLFLSQVFIIQGLHFVYFAFFLYFSLLVQLVCVYVDIFKW